MLEETNATKEEVLEEAPKNNTPRIIAGVILAIIAVLVLKTVFFGSAVAATVNGKKIYLSDVEDGYDKYLTTSKKKPKANEEDEIKSKVLDRLIDEEVIRQASKKEKIVISQREINGRIKKIKDKLSAAMFKENLKKNDWTLDDLIVFEKGEIFRQKLQKKLNNKDFPLNIDNYLYNFKRHAKIVIKIDKLNTPTAKLQLIPPVKNFRAIK